MMDVPFPQGDSRFPPLPTDLETAQAEIRRLRLQLLSANKRVVSTVEKRLKDNRAAARTQGAMRDQLSFMTKELAALKDLHSNLIRLGAEAQRKLEHERDAFRVLLDGFRGPECSDKECPDYDGQHPYHANAVEKFWREVQDSYNGESEKVPAAVQWGRRLQVVGEHCMRAGRSMTEVNRYTDADITRRVATIIGPRR